MSYTVPPGFTPIERSLEMVPNPNSDQPSFSRWTYSTRWTAKGITVSSGSPQDVSTQAHALYQSQADAPAAGASSPGAAYAGVQGTAYTGAGTGASKAASQSVVGASALVQPVKPFQPVGGAPASPGFTQWDGVSP